MVMVEEDKPVRVDTTLQHMRIGRGTQDIEFTKWWTRITPTLCCTAEYHCWTPLFGVIVFSSNAFLYNLILENVYVTLNSRNIHVLLEVREETLYDLISIAVIFFAYCYS